MSLKKRAVCSGSLATRDDLIRPNEVVEWTLSKGIAIPGELAEHFAAARVTETKEARPKTLGPNTVHLEGHFMHQPPNGEMSRQKSVGLLEDQIRFLAAQDGTRSSQVIFEFVQGILDFPALMVKRSQLMGRGDLSVSDGGRQAIPRLALLDSLKAILNHFDQDRLAVMPVVQCQRKVVQFSPVNEK